MEDKNAGSKLTIVIDPTYTLDRAKGITDLQDKNVYLYKNGAITNCPFISGIGMDWNTKGQALFTYPCGSSCQHFHMRRDTKKIIEKVDGVDKEKIVPTGKIKVGLSCGSSGVWFDIAGSEINENQPTAPQSNLKVTKSPDEQK